MADNDWKKRLGVVYSTNPDFTYKGEEQTEAEAVRPSSQQLRVWLDRKLRGGKQATLVKGFTGSQQELESLAKLLKTRCGVGGSAKDGEIIIQGDHRDRVIEILTKEGYGVKKAGG